MKFLLQIVCALFLAALPALAQVPESNLSSPGFDCWIGSDGKPYHRYYIRCMVDRDLAPVATAALDLRFEALMELLHQEFHYGTDGKAEELFNANTELLKENAGVWTISIFSPPSEQSWDEGLPERLARAVLCPREGQCSIVMRRR